MVLRWQWFITKMYNFDPRSFQWRDYILLRILCLAMSFSYKKWSLGNFDRIWYSGIIQECLLENVCSYTLYIIKKFINSIEKIKDIGRI